MLGKRILLLIFLSMMIGLSATAQDNKDIRKILDGHEIHVRGGIDGNIINFVSIGIDENNNGLGDNLFVIFDRNYKIKNYYKGAITSSVSMIDYNKNYIVFRMTTENGDRGIVAYDVKKNLFMEFPVNYAWMYNLFVEGNYAFFSSEKGHPHLNCIDLKNNKLYSFEDIDCECAEYGIYKNKVYAVSPDNDSVYRFTGKGFEEAKGIDKNKIQIKYSGIADYVIEDGIIDRLLLR